MKRICKGKITRTTVVHYRAVPGDDHSRGRKGGSIEVCVFLQARCGVQQQQLRQHQARREANNVEQSWDGSKRGWQTTVVSKIYSLVVA